jgi:hypothetical protein
MIAGIALVVCTDLLSAALTPGGPVAGYVLLPGVILGMLASVIVSGNPHGGSLGVVMVVARLANYFFYVIVVYCMLLLWRRAFKRI